MYWLGTISGSSGFSSNRATGVSGLGTFTIPAWVRSLYLVPSQSGIMFELSVATGITAFTNSTRAAQLAHDHTNGGWVEVNGPYKTIPGQNVAVGIYWAGAGFVSVRVFAGGQ